MKTILILYVSYNYFGDTILHFIDENTSYNMFQYTGAKQLLKRVKDFIEDGAVVLISESNSLYSSLVPALPFIEHIISLNDEVNNIRIFMPSNDSAGAEIAGHYGY